MSKFTFSLLISLLAANILVAQKTFNVTIKLDSSIVLRNIQYQYYNGKTIKFGPDSTNNKSTIVLTGVYYSPLASVTIGYIDTGRTYYGNDFFVSDKPAAITLHFSRNKNNKLDYTVIENATPIYDTIVNKIWASQTKFLTSPALQKENEMFDKFLHENKAPLSNDSLKLIYKKYYKIHLGRSMAFLKQYPNDYFSYWYFINQVNQVNRFLGKDRPYLAQQLAYVKKVFPAKFTESLEGKNLINRYETALKPVQQTQNAPPFTITTVDGRKLSLSSFKGKYVLLDFWATWCAPCMAQIPYVKEIRKKYPLEKLVIIGISWDRNVKTLKETATKTGMNWIQYFDEDQTIGNIYGVDAIPVIALINKKGNLIFKTDGAKDDKAEVSALLDDMD